MSKGLDFYNKQLAYLTSGDVEGLMRDLYHEDAEMVSFEFVLKGRDAIKKYLAEDEPAQAGNILNFETVQFAESDDVIMFTARVQSEKMGTFIARDALYLQDGKVVRHLSMTLPPDKEPKID